MKKRIDVSALTSVVGTLYPSPYDVPCRPRERTKLGDAAGLSQFGVNLLRLPPGAWSSQRHWHTSGDEFVYVLSGEVMLVTDGERASPGPGSVESEGRGEASAGRGEGPGRSERAGRSHRAGEQGRAVARRQGRRAHDPRPRRRHPVAPLLAAIRGAGAGDRLL